MHTPNICKHDEQGAYQNLIAGLLSEESDEFAKFHWIEPGHFDYILRKIDPVIIRFDKKIRKSISSAEKMANTILDMVLLSINI